MMSTSWRSVARPIVTDVVRRVGLADRKALRKALREAYPFGERAHWPYKAWLAEVKAQTGGLRSGRNSAAMQDLFNA